MRFVPKPDEDGKYVSCRATNPNFPDITREDGYIVRVKCKCIQTLSVKREHLKWLNCACIWILCYLLKDGFNSSIERLRLNDLLTSNIMEQEFNQSSVFLKPHFQVVISCRLWSTATIIHFLVPLLPDPHHIYKLVLNTNHTVLANILNFLWTSKTSFNSDQQGKTTTK